MESFVKSDDLEFPSDSPTYDFVTGFEHISGSFIPDHDSSSMYHYADISPASSSSPPGHAMSIDSNYPAPPRLSNNHRQARFLKGGAWSVADTSQRSPLPGNARPYGSQGPYGAVYELPSETTPQRMQQPSGIQYPQTSFQLRATGNRNTLPAMDPSTSYTSEALEQSSSAPGNVDVAGSVQLVIEAHPPVEVRTRTPSEKRNFSCSIQILGDYRAIGGKFVSVDLMYSPNAQRMPGEDEVPKQTILGGTKVVMIKANGAALFDNLSMSEASTRHKEKEFCLKFTLVDKSGAKLPVSARTTPFYAYSNTKVLARRRDIALRTLSKTFGVFQGGEAMHVIGAPFIRGPSLRLILRTEKGEAVATNLELYSETVLFFTLPACPGVVPGENEPMEVKAQVLVTNDGRNFSNAIEFLYVSNRRYSMRSYL